MTGSVHGKVRELQGSAPVALRRGPPSLTGADGEVLRTHGSSSRSMGRPRMGVEEEGMERAGRMRSGRLLWLGFDSLNPNPGSTPRCRKTTCRGRGGT